MGSIFFIHSQGNQSDLFQRSILSPILPEAMVCYLENHGKRSFLLLPQGYHFPHPFWFRIDVTFVEFFGTGHEKFAQIFLGEFDTPEAIWSNEMR